MPQESRNLRYLHVYNKRPNDCLLRAEVFLVLVLGVNANWNSERILDMLITAVLMQNDFVIAQ